MATRHPAPGSMTVDPSHLLLFVVRGLRFQHVDSAECPISVGRLAFTLLARQRQDRHKPQRPLHTAEAAVADVTAGKSSSAPPARVGGQALRRMHRPLPYR